MVVTIHVFVCFQFISMQEFKMKRFVCFHLCLAFVVVTVVVAGCGGTPLTSIGTRIQDADRKFDTAEAFRIQADEDTERDKRCRQVEQKNALYNDALEAYRAIVKADPPSKYAQRSLWQISDIYKRQYEWDKVIDSYEAILAINSSGYYADRARSAIADMRKYRLLIQEKSRKYQNCQELYAQDNAREYYDLAARALFDVAEGYEKLSSYPEAIAHYAQVVDEFPDYEQAPVALTRIGDIYFYKLYDYDTSFPVYNKVIEMYPDTYDATMAIRLLKNSDRNLREIAHYQTEIDRFWNEATMEYRVTNRKMSPNKKYSFRRIIPIVVLNYQAISRRWQYLRNFPSAILASRNSIIAYEAWTAPRLDSTFTIADTHYRISRLYQLNDQLEQAIEAYQELLDNNPDSGKRSEGIYQQSVCYRRIREFTKSYEGFKAYMSLGPDAEYYQEAEQNVRQIEMDEDGDGYKSYIEQNAGTSDQDPNDYPRVKF